MLDKEYLNSFNHFLDVLIHQETEDKCLDLLLSIDRTRLNSYFYNIEVLSIILDCLKFSNNIDCIPLYKSLINGLRIELKVGVTMN